MRLKASEILPLQEAMNNLAAIASIHMESPPPIGIIQETRLVTNKDEIETDEVRWISGEGADPILKVLDLTYASVHQHLQSLYENPGMDWEDKKSRDGIAAMMALVGESVQKMNAYLEFRFDHPISEKIEQRESYRAMQRFYSERFAKKIVGGVEGKDAWEKEWFEKHSLLQATGTELQDFEALLRDKEYELFYVANEEGTPYLSEKLLRNVKLTVDFDIKPGSFEEDPFLKVKAILDRDLQATAAWIVKECEEEITLFYKIVKSAFQVPAVKILSKAMIALFLAANTRHLIQRTTGKTCTHYFHDFHLFLRETMKSDEYTKWITYSPSEHAAQVCIRLVEKLCYVFITRPCGVKQEAIGLIHRTIRRGGDTLTTPELGDSPWNRIIFDDEKFRTLLHRFPSGPMLKILETIRVEQEEGAIVPFDPWMQGNIPQKLYTMHKGKKEIAMLSFAAPLKQTMIHKVEILDEFRGFLRHLSVSGNVHLLINLQDRLSWRETARSTAIEDLQKNPNFKDVLVVITLPKDTDFYHQRNEFQELEIAGDFIAAFRSQITHAKENGFYFPSKWPKEALLDFCDQTFAKIHRDLFGSKDILSRQMREDFIEIFYQHLCLEAIDRFAPATMSFTCKDTVDTGAYATGLFYGFLKAYEGNLLLPENIDFTRFLFYWRALSVRERAADPEQFLRSISALESWINQAQLFKIAWTV
ncbi:MAG TPA: hypothetical protein VLE96_05270 [Chlamydiales bacterium]|nr:hypothetical protein [Chlamydiales bacterium]